MTDLAPSPLSAGTVIAGTYRITHRLGRGGMGEVWAAEHQRLPGKQVAIKVLNANYANDPDVLARFRREAEIASRLAHPNIVEIHDYNVLEDQTPYLVLELLAGESLDERLARGALPPAEALRILQEVCSALRVAHRAGVVHRDLKPQNVFLCAERDDKPGPSKVLDFGISKIRGSNTVRTQTETVLGTPQYMSPEQALGKHDQVDARTDIFCLGIMAYEMLSGRPPFTGQTLPEVVFKIVYEPEPPLGEVCPGVAANVVAAVHKALSKNQDDRFASVDEFLIALGLPVPRSGVQPLMVPPDAFAQTAPSNRHQSEDFGIAPTVDSGADLRSALDDRSPAADAPPRRRIWPIALAVVGAAALASLITIFAVRSGGGNDERDRRVASQHPPTTDDPRPEPTETKVTNHSVDAGIEVAPTPDAASPVDENADETEPAETTTAVRTEKSRTRPTPAIAGSSDAGPTPSQTEVVDARAPSGRSPLPGLARVKRLPPEAREKIVAALRAYRGGDLRQAARLAAQARREPGGEVVGLIVEIVARCDHKEHENAAPLLRLVRKPTLQKNLQRYCETKGVFVEL